MKLPPHKPSYAPAFLDVQWRERALRRELEKLSVEQLEQFEMLTWNGKTACSFDFPPGSTCSPTFVCVAHCYAIRPGSPLLWDKSIRKRLRNLLFVLKASPHRVVAALTREYRKRQQLAIRHGFNLTFIRFLGSGDLFPELVIVINLFAAMNPDIVLWIATRKFDLADEIELQPNVRLLLSLDSSTTHTDRAAVEALVDKGSQVQTTFLKTKFGEDTMGAAVVYPVEPYLGEDPRVDCPVDAGRLSRGQRGKAGFACVQCARCPRPFGQRTWR